MNTLILDRSDEDVDRMVSAWVNGGNYQVLLRIQQIATEPKMATFRVTEIQNETEGEESSNEPAGEETSPQNSTTPAPASKPAVQVKYRA
jgi:hypothetical protein